MSFDCHTCGGDLTGCGGPPCDCPKVDYAALREAEIREKFESWHTKRYGPATLGNLRRASNGNYSIESVRDAFEGFKAGAESGITEF